MNNGNHYVEIMVGQAQSTGVALAVDPDTVGEGDMATTVTVTAKLNSGTRTTATPVAVTVGPGTATAVADFAAVTGFNVDIAANQERGTHTFTLTPTEDMTDEPNETVWVSGTATGLPVTGAAVTIEDNDEAPIQLVGVIPPVPALTLGGAAHTVDVSPYFRDADGDALNYTVASGDESIVTVSIVGSTVTITPVAVGTVTITVTAGNSDGTVSRTFSVLVNALPIAGNGSLATSGGVAQQIDLSTLASDPEGGELTYATTDPTNGSVSLTGSVATYTPNTDFTGEDSFTYTVADSDGASATGTITVTVVEPAVGQVITPTAIAQTAGDSSSGYSFNIDNLIDGSGLSKTPTVANLSSVTHDAVPTANVWVTNTQGSPHYFGDSRNHPDPQFTLTLDKRYSLSSLVIWGVGGNTNEASDFTVEFSTDGGITYNAMTETVRTDGVAGNNHAQLSFIEAREANFVRLTITNNAKGRGFPGTAGERVALGEIRFTGVVVEPAVGQVITPTEIAQTAGDSRSDYSFNIDNLIDGSGLSNAPTVANLSSVIHNAVPTANVWVTNTQGSPHYFGDSRNHPDPQFTLTLDERYSLSSLVIWGVGGNTNEASDFTVEFSTDGGITYNAMTETVRTDGVAGNNHAQLSFIEAHEANFVRLTITNNAKGRGFSGTAGEQVALGEIRFTGTASNRSPVASPGSLVTLLNTAGTLDLSTLTSDPDGGELTYATTDPTNGTVSLTGSVATYTPSAGYHGSDSFTYTVKDSENTGATGTVSVTIHRAPTAQNATRTTPENTELMFDLSPLAFDPDGDTLTWMVGAASHGMARLQFVTGGSVIYTPNAGYVGIDRFTYTVADGHGATATGTITVAVGAALLLNLNVIAGDDKVNIEEKATGFAISGDTGSEGGVTVTVTVGTTPLTATSAPANPATWLVSVPANASYISEPSVAVEVNASKTGFDAASAVQSTLAVDLTAPTAPTYTAPGSLQVGVAITAMSPSGGSGINEYSATGLPAGLRIDTTMGVISGTPDTADASTANATVTASDAADNTATVLIAFPPVAKGDQTLTGFQYSSNTVTLGSTVPTVTAPSGAQGALSYSVTASTVCAVGSSTGVLTLVGVGECEVTATAADTADYNQATATYTVTVQPVVLTADGASISAGNLLIQLDSTGVVTGLRESDARGTDHNIAAQSTTLVSLVVESASTATPSLGMGAHYKPTGWSYTAGTAGTGETTRGTYTFNFADNISVVVTAVEKAGHATLELTSVTNPDSKDIRLVIWGPLTTDITENIGDTVGVVSNRDFAIGMFGVNAKTTGGWPKDYDHLGFRSSAVGGNPGAWRTRLCRNRYWVCNATPTTFGSILQTYTRDYTVERVFTPYANGGRRGDVALPVTPLTGNLAMHGQLVGSKVALFRGGPLGCGSGQPFVARCPGRGGAGPDRRRRGGRGDAAPDHFQGLGQEGGKGQCAVFYFHGPEHRPPQRRVAAGQRLGLEEHLPGHRLGGVQQRQLRVRQLLRRESVGAGVGDQHDQGETCVAGHAFPVQFRPQLAWGAASRGSVRHVLRGTGRCHHVVVDIADAEAVPRDHVCQLD